MPEPEYKRCETCGETFTRNPKYSQTQWATVRYCSRACIPHPRRKARPTEIKVCPVCGGEFGCRDDQIPSQFERQVHCSVDCGRRARFLRDQREHPTRLTSDRRYRLRFVSGRVDAPSRTSQAGAWILEHRLVMEEHLGRPLAADEHVHHRNENGLDNRLENLEVLSQSEHMRLHATGREHPKLPRLTCVCPICGDEFSVRQHEYRKRKKKAKSGLVVCSTRCARKVAALT